MLEIRKWLPSPARRVLEPIRAMRYRGVGRLCPVCRKPSREFARSGEVVVRADAKCIYCGALERHRLVWLFFDRRTSIFRNPPARMLHIAPEPILTRLLRSQLGDAYLTADLEADDPLVDVRMDISNIQYSDETFDAIYCSHVFEHVNDDRKAMRELRRVLTADGWAVLLVPITAPRTYEDPTVTDPDERLRLFGQRDHVRRYGPDYVERLREAGFDATIIRPSDFLTASEIERMGITEAAGDIYFCRRADTSRVSGTDATVAH